MGLSAVGHLTNFGRRGTAPTGSAWGRGALVGVSPESGTGALGSASGMSRVARLPEGVVGVQMHEQPDEAGVIGRIAVAVSGDQEPMTTPWKWCVPMVMEAVGITGRARACYVEGQLNSDPRKDVSAWEVSGFRSGGGFFRCEAQIGPQKGDELPVVLIRS
ncbi:hypothetical protein CSA80_04525 [Candidatus Saccharibacteria bacterium]|nr:MAG: hypothetical protein CR973_01400 [Candidatus Saccharibacteria bacterium]PID98933.1 MAG: hypothetical protein CSA80_04525 [Candidatus Saccharibacteria bacterium]